MKNRLSDLNNHLFAQLEQLSDEDLSSEAIGDEVRRAAAIVEISDQIVGNAKLQLDACRLVAAYGDKFKGHLLPMLAAPGPATIEGQRS